MQCYITSTKIKDTSISSCRYQKTYLYIDYLVNFVLLTYLTKILKTLLIVAKHCLIIKDYNDIEEDLNFNTSISVFN